MRIKDDVSNKLVINKSEFICYLSKCYDENSCRNFIDKVRKEHSQANHVCTAYITNHNMVKKTSDDGEPSKTAGMPMLDALEKNNMEDICACVVRYFGGIKLGAGGLIRAYSNAVSEALKVAVKCEAVKMYIYDLKFTYDWIDKLNYYLKDVYIADKQYDEMVCYRLYLNSKDEADKIYEFVNGKFELVFIEEKEVEKAI